MSRPLRLAVDARDLARDERGIGTYARAVLRRFARRDDIALTLLVQDWFPATVAARLRTSIGAGAGSPPVRIANHVPRDTQVLWHPWNGTFFAPPPAVRDRLQPVATLHDLVPFAFPVNDAKRRASQQAPFVRTAQTAKHIMCDSHFTAAQAERYLGVEPAALSVVPLGVDPIFAPGDLTALPAQLHDRRYVLYVGAHDAHKNVSTLIAAHRAAFGDGDVALVFTRRVANASDALVFERVSVTTLVALYRGASLVAVPSVYEGFGLPVLEAMACGAPVLASRAASLPEVGGEVAAYVERPREITAWRDRLRELIGDSGRRSAMAHDGPLRASLFSWETCAERTLQVLHMQTSAEKTTGLNQRTRLY